MKRLLILLFLVSFLFPSVLLSGCGQTGALYLPGHPPPDSSAASKLFPDDHPNKPTKSKH